MIKIILSLLISSFGVPNNLEWYDLTWGDYIGTPKGNWAARTEYEVDFYETVDNGCHTFKVKTYFLPEGSFTRTNSQYVLRHEQLHMALVEAYKFKMWVALVPYQGCREKSLNDVKRIYNRLFAELQREQIKYDSETAHSVNRIEQAKWDKRIRRELTTSCIASVLSESCLHKTK